MFFAPTTTADAEDLFVFFGAQETYASQCHGSSEPTTQQPAFLFCAFFVVFTACDEGLKFVLLCACDFTSVLTYPAGLFARSCLLVRFRAVLPSWPRFFSRPCRVMRTVAHMSGFSHARVQIRVQVLASNA